MRRKVLALFSVVLAAAALGGCSAPGKMSEPVASKDIASAADGVHLGSGWYPFEQYQGQTFRWVNNDAEIVACPAAGHATISLELEPGPSLGSKKMTLLVRSAEGTSQILSVLDRRVVRIALANSAPQTLVLHVQSRGLRVPREKRMLNFRVFSISLGSNASACPKDVLRDGSPLKLGAGWYAGETNGGESFRWVNNDAEIVLTKSTARPFKLEADVEPGPGLAGAPLILTLTDSSGHPVGKTAPVAAREVVSFPLHAATAKTRYRLRVASPDKRVPGDARILNFRVFDIHAVPLAK